MDNCKNAPCLIVGDFNTRLPYASNSFGKRSAISYNVIADNEMAVNNFCFNQDCIMHYVSRIRFQKPLSVLQRSHLGSLLNAGEDPALQHYD